MKALRIAALLLVPATLTSCEKERCYTCTEVVGVNPFVGGRNSYKETTICGYTEAEKRKHEEDGSSSIKYNKNGTIVTETQTTRCRVED